MNNIPTDEQWVKMQKFLKTDKYKKEDFFVFETLAVGDKIVPNRYIKIMPDLLQVMMEDANKGVSLMLNHNESQEGVQAIPIGKVFEGRISGSSQEGESLTLYTTQYILRDDSKVDGYSKNDIIKLIETGTLSDTSIGWGTTADQYKCNICGNSIYDWRHCEHIPGQKYIINKETEEVKECIIEAHAPKELNSTNNVLMENSLVFDGAYPNAMVQSSLVKKLNKENNEFEMIDGKEKMNTDTFIFAYSTNGSINLLKEKAIEKGGVNMKEEKEKFEKGTEEIEKKAEEVETEETKETEIKADEKAENELDAENAEITNEEVNEEISEEAYTENEILSKAGNITNSFENLVSLAKEGLEYRNSEIDKALESGVHAMGNAFNKEAFKKTFSNMNTKDIKEMGKAWEDEAVKLFKKPKVSKQDFSQEENEKTDFNYDLNNLKTDRY